MSTGFEIAPRPARISRIRRAVMADWAWLARNSERGKFDRAFPAAVAISFEMFANRDAAAVLKRARRKDRARLEEPTSGNTLSTT